MWLYALPLLILHPIVALIRNTLSSFKHLCPPGSFTNSVFAAAFDYVWQIQCHLLALRFLSPPFFPCVISEMSLRAALLLSGPWWLILCRGVGRHQGSSFGCQAPGGCGCVNANTLMFIVRRKTKVYTLLCYALCIAAMFLKGELEQARCC